MDKKEEKKVKVDNGLAAKVRGLEERVDRMQENWRKFKASFVGASKDVGFIRPIAAIIICALMISLSIGVARVLDRFDGGPGTTSTVGTATVETDDAGTCTLTVDAFVGDLTGDVTGAVSGGAVTATTFFTAVPGSLTVTNGQAIAATTSYMKITPSAVATCTVANASAAGQVLVLENVGTNNLILEDSTTALALGGNITNGATDTVTLIANAAAQWRLLSNSNN